MHSLEKEHRLFYSLVKQMGGLEGLGRGQGAKGRGKLPLL